MSTQLAKSSGLLTLEVVDNFNPTLINSQVLFKNINITIEPALPGVWVMTHIDICWHFYLGSTCILINFTINLSCLVILSLP